MYSSQLELRQRLIYATHSSKSRSSELFSLEDLITINFLSKFRNLFAMFKMKGQINIDFVVSFGLFLVVLIYIFNFFNDYWIAFGDYHKTIAKQVKAMDIASILVTLPGYWNAGSNSGYDWENHIDNVKIIGLAQVSDPFILSQEKINALNNSLNYSLLKEIWGTYNDYAICISNCTNGCTDNCDIAKIGEFNVSVIKGKIARYVLINNSGALYRAKVEVFVI